MFQDKYVFSQLTAFLNRTQFNNYVRKYGGNRYVKHFTCWNQMLAMMFGQLSNRESLRDLIVAFEAHRAKQYHLGLGREPIAKTTLATANRNRDYRIFEEFAFYMMKEACEKRTTNILDISGKKYAFDSTTIPLCLATFPWAKFRNKKGGVKAHVLYDIEAQVPAFYTVTTASKHDSTLLSSIHYEPNAYYIFDRAYDSFKELYKIHLTDSFFVVRAKTNLKYKTVQWKRRMPKNIMTDAEVKLTGYLSEKKYPESLRLVRYYDEEDTYTLAKDILKFMKKKIDTFSEQNNLNFVLTAYQDDIIETEFKKQDAAIFGKIKDVTNKDKYSNGIDLSIDFLKQATLQKYLLGGTSLDIICKNEKQLLEKYQYLKDSDVGCFRVN